MSDDPDFEYLIIDSTVVRAHQHAAETKRGAEDQALGCSRGGLSTKIHMAVRGLGCPIRFTLTAGQKGDAPQAAALVECYFSKFKQFRRVVTRFEKTARNYRAVVILAATILWLR